MQKQMSNETKQTAVEWLEEIVNKNGLQMSDYLKFTFEQAKEMEKEQMIDAYWDGGQDVPLHINTCEEWYKRTYGGNK
jgi:DNA polymerase III psi subunit